MRKFLVCAIFALSISQAQGAIFITSYEKWQKMTPQQKAGFVMGIWDVQANMVGDEAGPYEESFMDGFTKCGNDLDLRSKDLVMMVDRYYEENPHQRKEPAFLALTMAMVDICQGYINQVRQERGLDRLIDVNLLNRKR